jgi:hypothetical protein
MTDFQLGNRAEHHHSFSTWASQPEWTDLMLAGVPRCFPNEHDQRRLVAYRRAIRMGLFSDEREQPSVITKLEEICSNSPKN